jgi:hypothetical protein
VSRRRTSPLRPRNSGICEGKRSASFHLGLGNGQPMTSPPAQVPLGSSCPQKGTSKLAEAVYNTNPKVTGHASEGTAAPCDRRRPRMSRENDLGVALSEGSGQTLRREQLPRLARRLQVRRLAEEHIGGSHALPPQSDRSGCPCSGCSLPTITRLTRRGGLVVRMGAMNRPHANRLR